MTNVDPAEGGGIHVASDLLTVYCRVMPYFPVMGWSIHVRIVRKPKVRIPN